MDDLDFFVDLLITGTVLGLDHTSSPVEVERVFGPARTYAAPSGRITDTGLVEFGWWDGRVTYFGAQVHRLRSDQEPGGPLVERYGPFRPLLDVDELLAAVRARGFAPEEVPPRGKANAGYLEYREPSTGVGVLYLADPDQAGERGPAGRVAKMLRGTPEVQETGAVERWLVDMEDRYADARELSGRDLVEADEIRRARALRDRIHAISTCGPHVTPPALADRLRAWTELRPLLLGPVKGPLV